MACIGIVDSGLGGLTVWQAIRERRPELPCLYLADQAHLPYGPRSQAEIRRLCTGITEALLAAGARLIVLACNTASAAALKHLRERFPDIAFVGMEPAVKPAALHTRSGVVGLMATRGTLRGELLRDTAARFAEHVEIVSSDCPGLAEAIEAGVPSAELRPRIAAHVREMQRRGADTIVLGCTHYPLITDDLLAVLGPDVHLIDPAPAVARQVDAIWRARGLQRAGRADPRFASSAGPERLRQMLQRHYGLRAAVESWHWRGDRLIMALDATPLEDTE